MPLPATEKRSLSSGRVNGLSDQYQKLNMLQLRSLSFGPSRPHLRATWSKYITQQVWGTSWESNVASLRVFMATLRKKLESSSGAQVYIQTHVGIGYRMVKVNE